MNTTQAPAPTMSTTTAPAPAPSAAVTWVCQETFHADNTTSCIRYPKLKRCVTEGLASNMTRSQSADRALSPCPRASSRSSALPPRARRKRPRRTPRPRGRGRGKRVQAPGARAVSGGRA
ncbi:hypothetical protein BG000_002309 [Podila horticola]|nr:hypothetical protein BG000_002309 [Podila horticola]